MSVDGIMLHLPSDPHQFYKPDNSSDYAGAHGVEHLLVIPDEKRSSSGPPTPIPVMSYEAPAPVAEEKEIRTAASDSSGTPDVGDLLRKVLLREQPSDPPHAITRSRPLTTFKVTQFTLDQNDNLINLLLEPTSPGGQASSTCSEILRDQTDLSGMDIESHPITALDDDTRSPPSQPVNPHRAKRRSAVTGGSGTSIKSLKASNSSTALLPPNFSNDSTAFLPPKARNASSASLPMLARDHSRPLNLIDAFRKQGSNASPRAKASNASLRSNASRLSVCTTHSIEDSAPHEPSELGAKLLKPAQERMKGIDAVSAVIGGVVV